MWTICVDVGDCEQTLSQLYRSFVNQNIRCGQCLLIAKSTEQYQRLQLIYQSTDTEVILALQEGWIERFRTALALADGELILCVQPDCWLHPKTMELAMAEWARYPHVDLFSFTVRAILANDCIFSLPAVNGVVPGRDDGGRLTYLDLVLYGPFLHFFTSVWRRASLEDLFARCGDEVIHCNALQPESRGSVRSLDFLLMLTAARLGKRCIGIAESGPMALRCVADDEEDTFAIWQHRFEALQMLRDSMLTGNECSELMAAYQDAISLALRYEAQAFRQTIAVHKSRQAMQTFFEKPKDALPLQTKCADSTPLLSYIVLAGEKLWPIEETLRSLLVEQELNWEAVVVFPPQVRPDRWLRMLDGHGRLRALNLTISATLGASLNAGLLVAKGVQCVFLQAGTRVEAGHTRAVMTAPQRTLPGSVGCCSARLILLDRERRNGWVSANTFCAPTQLALEWCPGIPLDALSFQRADLFQRGPFVEDSHAFPGWDMLQRQQVCVYELPTTIDVYIRAQAVRPNGELENILASVDRQYNRFDARDTTVAERRKVYRSGLVKAFEQLRIDPENIEHIDFWCKALSGIAFQ